MAKILLVEDNEALRELFLTVFANAGYESHTALNAQEALNWLEREKFDVVISDVAMPKMSGLELYERVKEMDKNLAANMILITGVSDAHTRDFLEQNQIPYLFKPFQVKRLLDLAAWVLHRSRLKDGLRKTG